MMYLPTILGYFMTLILCILIALRVENLFLQWALLELNMLCFIPIFISRKTSNSTTNRLKYFVSQSSASLLFIIIIMLPLNSPLIILLLIIFKIGVPPFQRWLTAILPTLNLSEIFILFTIQKFLPLIILSQFNSGLTLFIFILASFLFTLVRSSSTTSLYKLLFISSVVNIIWTLINLWNRWLIFFCGYTRIFGGLIINLSLFSISKTRDLIVGPTIAKIIIPIQFFNLGGVPPLAGFNLKLMLLNKIVNFNPPMTLILLISTLITLYLYTIIFYQANCITVSSMGSKLNLERNQQSNIALGSLIATSFILPIII